MNNKIKELAEQVYGMDTHYDDGVFAELIIRECLKVGKEIQKQNISNASEDYNNGRQMGIEVFMNQISHHFGVE